MFDKTLLTLPGMRRTLALLAIISLAKTACIITQACTLAAALSGLWGGPGNQVTRVQRIS